MSLYKQVLTTFILLYATSCTEDKKALDSQNAYFDIRGFFTTEAARLAKQDPLITKRVDHNNDAEEKKLTISDWKQELDLFISSDINKPSWKDSYTTTREGNVTTYAATDSNLKVQKIRLERTGKKISAIEISNRVDNEIYRSTETLTYYPDSLYRIVKRQDVRGLGLNNYSISGKIKP